MFRLVALLLAAQAAAGSEVFEDPDAGYSFIIPEGFIAEPGDRITRGAPVCWLNTIDMRSWMRLCAMRLDGELAREDGAAAGGQGMQAESFRWKSFDIPGVRMASTAEEGAATMYQAVVPLRSNAVRLTMMSPEIDADRARAALVSVISSLEGESNWLQSAERAEKGGQFIGQIGMIIMAIGVGMWIMQRRQRKQQQAPPPPTRKPRKP